MKNNIIKEEAAQKSDKNVFSTFGKQSDDQVDQTMQQTYSNWKENEKITVEEEAQI